MSNLEIKLRNLIAKEHNVAPSEVDLDFIERKSEELYADPNHRFTLDSGFGGYDITGLELQNKSEIEAEAEAANAFLSRFAKKKT